MNEYIFYTTEGFTQDPNGNDVENCQLLGRSFGIDSNDAMHNLLKDNEWIVKHGFDPKEFICKRIIEE